LRQQVQIIAPEISGVYTNYNTHTSEITSENNVYFAFYQKGQQSLGFTRGNKGDSPKSTLSENHHFLPLKVGDFRDE